MSYFSRVTLHANDREQIKQLHRLRNQPYAQHRALWQMFDRPPGAEQPFLFREVANDEPRQLQLYLLSDTQPHAKNDGWRLECKPFEPKLHVNDRFHFSIRLNPTRTERDHGGGSKRGKRQDYVMSQLQRLQVPLHERAEQRQRIIHEELPTWLQQRATTRGFEVEHCIVERFDVLRIRKSEHEVSLSVADFSGSLHVTDVDLFRNVLSHGVGHGRSFGMGLMLLKPAR